MTRLSWDDPKDRLYEVGIDRGVLYTSKGIPVPWNGLVSVKESSADASSSMNYVDGYHFGATHTPGSFAATVTAFTYPDEVEQRNPFGFSYRTLIGDSVLGTDRGYKIHLVYNARASLSDKTFDSWGSSTNAMTFSWNLSTKPIALANGFVGAHLIVDTTQAYAWTVEALEAVLYGTDVDQGRLPSPDDVLALFDDNSILKITDHGDGTWTAEGPDNVVSMLSATEFQINWPSVVYIASDEYQVSSL